MAVQIPLSHSYFHQKGTLIVQETFVSNAHCWRFHCDTENVDTKIGFLLYSWQARGQDCHRNVPHVTSYPHP